MADSTTKLNVSCRLQLLSPQSGQRDILAALAPLCNSYLEVGVQEGHSLRVVLESGPDIDEIVLCDTWGGVSGGTNRGNHDHINRLLLEYPQFKGEVQFFDGDSRDSLRQIAGLGHQFDLVHIDGGHSKEVCLSDLTWGSVLCKKVMVIHDTRMKGVQEAMSEYLCSYGLFGCVRYYLGGHGTAVIVSD